MRLTKATAKETRSWTERIDGGCIAGCAAIQIIRSGRIYGADTFVLHPVEMGLIWSAVREAREQAEHKLWRELTAQGYIPCLGKTYDEQQPKGMVEQ